MSDEIVIANECEDVGLGLSLVAARFDDCTQVWVDVPDGVVMPQHTPMVHLSAVQCRELAAWLIDRVNEVDPTNFLCLVTYMSEAGSVMAAGDEQE